MTNSTQPFVSLGLLIDDDTALTPRAHGHEGDVIAVVQLGTSGTVIQSSSPAALRRLAAALNDAADKAETITEAGE